MREGVHPLPASEYKIPELNKVTRVDLRSYETLSNEAISAGHVVT
jgi:hypothetical protein